MRKIHPVRLYRKRVNQSKKKLKGRYLQNFVFIHINKTGGSSISKALNLYFEHKTAVEKIQELGKRRWEKRFSFTIVRNPWDRAVSHYHFRLQTNQTNLREKIIPFDEWVKQVYVNKNPRYVDKPKMFLPQWHWLINQEGKLAVDFVGRFEKLATDFQFICQKIQRESPPLPHIKKSNRNSYQQYYTQETLDIIAAYFKDDIEAFGYQF